MAGLFTRRLNDTEGARTQYRLVLDAVEPLAEAGNPRAQLMLARVEILLWLVGVSDKSHYTQRLDRAIAVLRDLDMRLGLRAEIRAWLGIALAFRARGSVNMGEAPATALPFLAQARTAAQSAVTLAPDDTLALNSLALADYYTAYTLHEVDPAKGLEMADLALSLMNRLRSEQRLTVMYTEAVGGVRARILVGQGQVAAAIAQFDDTIAELRRRIAAEPDEAMFFRILEVTLAWMGEDLTAYIGADCMQARLISIWSRSSRWPPEL